MIKLININKYFFKNKANENQVCKDINLEFKEKGFVVILGSSGSGKTTLLNIISGMDKFDDGTLIFKEEKFEKYQSKKWDKIRNCKIGYIFQNYNLFKDLTVYQNIELVLKMNGVILKEEIDRIVDYLLESVGMKNYENRLVKQLSGGQQQRIGFARALSKKPDLILADEPTGNLDSKTTIELMDILKSISSEKLVIMVTHEQALAEFYADRIIEIENGRVVSDKENVKSEKLSITQEQIIYLKDYEKKETNLDDLVITKYSDSVENKHIKIDVIDKQDTIYLKVGTNGSKRIKYIDSDSEIELLNKSSKDVVKTNKPFDFKSLLSKSISEKRSVITISDSFKLALRKINILSYGGKMLFLVLALVGVIISISSGLLAESYRDENIIIDQSIHYIEVFTSKKDYDAILALEDLDGVEQVMLISEEFVFHMSSNKYYEISNSVEVSAYPIDIKFLDESKLIIGNVPSGYGIVIDKIVADKIIEENSYRGIDSYTDILNSSFKIQTSGSDANVSLDNSIEFPITGIVNDSSKSVWMAEELIYSFITPSLVDYHIFEDNFNITFGDLPSTYKELILNENSHFIHDGELPYRIGTATGEYTISGVFEYVKDGREYSFSNIYVTTPEFLKRVLITRKYYFREEYNFLVYSNEVEETIPILNDLGYEASSSYLNEVERSKIFKIEENANIFLLSIGGIVISAISMYFIMRSSLISRVYEVSIFRSLGASKREIRKMFIVEIFMTTSLSSIIGYIAMSLLLVQIQSSAGMNINIVHYSFTTLLIGIIGLYLLNIIFGLIPINILLSKTPSDIMKKYDL